jgi:hypothetical protein
VAQEVALPDVLRDPREVLCRLLHRRAVVETAPDTPVLDILDEVVEALVGARGLARCARVVAGRPPDRGVADVAS